MREDGARPDRPGRGLQAGAVVDRLPKTRSGKILRATMVSIADGADWKMPGHGRRSGDLDEIAEALRSIGYAK